MTRIIPVASGKGGTGKSIFALNLAIALSLRRKTVVLIDLDLGGSNLHTLFGIDSRKPGIGDLVFKNEPNINSLISETDIERLFFIKGDSNYPATAHLGYAVKEKIRKEITRLIADYVILDLGAGSFSAIVDFFLTSTHGVLVVTPEVTSILNAYSFLKTALYRLLSRSFARQSEERKIIYSFVKNPDAKSKGAFSGLVRLLGEKNPASGAIARSALSGMKTGLVINMTGEMKDLEVGRKLAGICAKNLEVSLDFFGILPRSAEVAQSILLRKPVLLLVPVCRFSESVDFIAKKIIAGGQGAFPDLFSDDDEMAEDPIEKLSGM
jgi:flagellar biosynthesis protein FlhG